MRRGNTRGFARRRSGGNRGRRLGRGRRFRSASGCWRRGRRSCPAGTHHVGACKGPGGALRNSRTRWRSARARGRRNRPGRRRGWSAARRRRGTRSRSCRTARARNEHDRLAIRTAAHAARKRIIDADLFLAVRAADFHRHNPNLVQNGTTPGRRGLSSGGQYHYNSLTAVQEQRARGTMS